MSSPRNFGIGHPIDVVSDPSREKNTIDVFNATYMIIVTDFWSQGKKLSQNILH